MLFVTFMTFYTRKINKSLCENLFSNVHCQLFIDDSPASCHGQTNEKGDVASSSTSR